MLKFTLLITCFLVSSLYAQYSLSGHIVDENDSLVPFTNVLILNSSDSSIVKGSISDDGNFLVKNVNLEKGILKISAVGFDNYLVEFSKPSNKLIEFGTIKLSTTEMKGVEIIASRPIFISKGDRIVVDVENSSLSDQGSAFDVLRSSPKILIGSNDNITVIGKGSPVITSTINQ